LKEEAMFFKINEKNITELCDMDISDLDSLVSRFRQAFIKQKKRIATEVVKEINDRLNFYECRFGIFGFKPKFKSLSGGEAQRIRLATQIG
jgi:excinuclease ABC subunit A